MLHKSNAPYRAVVFISILMLSFTLGLSNGVAMDEEGCLTCHQYPGLVRLEEHSRFKALQIDEEKYLKSPHGKLHCRQCHITIVKVPHTGETKVDCTTKCHKGDTEKKLPDNYSLKGFHKKEQSYLASLRDESSCRVCHPLYPHSSNNLVRAFLNLHAGFIFCDVCHIKKSRFDHLAYGWKNSENAEFHGVPFGTFYNPQTKKAGKSIHFISRIAVFTTEKGKKRLLTHTWDTAKAKAFVLKETRLKPSENKKQLAYFHKDIEKKEISVACNECHSKNSIINFQNLGFDKKKAKDLTYLNIKGLVTKYKTFYFPNLFGR